VQAETKTPDTAGGYTLGWINFASVVGPRLKPVSGQEHLLPRIWKACHAQVTMRYLSGVHHDMRVFYNSPRVQHPCGAEPDERNQWTELLVEEGAAV